MRPKVPVGASGARTDQHRLQAGHPPQTLTYLNPAAVKVQRVDPPAVLIEARSNRVVGGGQYRASARVGGAGQAVCCLSELLQPQPGQTVATSRTNAVPE